MSLQLEQPRQTSARARIRLIWTFAVRDLKARFTATSLGLLWTLIVPLATVAIYSMVFAVIFRAQAPPMGNGEDGIFALWFFAGLVTWNVFSLSTGAALGSILGMGGMLQKVFIPSYVPVLAAVTTVTVERVLEAGVMLFLLLIFMNVGWTWLLYPLLFLSVAVFAASLGYLLAIANVYFRDTAQIFGVVMQLWFFLTPVMYPIEMIPKDVHGIPLRGLLAINPMTDFVGMGRQLVYELRLPSTFEVVYAGAWILALAGAAVFVYRRWGKDVSEAI